MALPDKSPRGDGRNWRREYPDYVDQAVISVVMDYEWLSDNNFKILIDAADAYLTDNGTIDEVALKKLALDMFEQEIASMIELISWWWNVVKWVYTWLFEKNLWWANQRFDIRFHWAKIYYRYVNLNTSVKGNWIGSTINSIAKTLNQN